MIQCIEKSIVHCFVLYFCANPRLIRFGGLRKLFSFLYETAYYNAQ